MAITTSKSVFISYRDKASGLLAPFVYQYLTSTGGYTKDQVFYAPESLGAGKFGDYIYDAINAHPYFIFILSPNTLEKCPDKKDWVRNELYHAQNPKHAGTKIQPRVIIPLVTEDFNDADIREYLPPLMAKRLMAYEAILDISPTNIRQKMERLFEMLVPLEHETIPIPRTEKSLVKQAAVEAAKQPHVTKTQLTSQQYFERALARASNDLNGKIADYTEALRLNSVFPYAYTNRAAARLRIGDLDGAVADCESALALNPYLAEAYGNRGSVRSELGKLAEAIADFEEAIRLNPQDAKAYSARGQVYGKQLNWNAAIEDFNRAIRLDPLLAEAYNGRAWTKYLQKDYEGALQDCADAIRLGPNYWAIYHSRGSIYVAKGDKVAACTDFQKALNLLAQSGETPPELAEMQTCIAKNCP